MSVDCADFTTLVSYWLGELGDREDAFEAHLLGCAACTERLQGVVALGAGVAVLAARGRVFASVTREHVERAAAEGLRTNTYRIRPGESVHCTITPDDDANVLQLVADFADAERVDLESFAVEGEDEQRIEHVENLLVDRTTGEAVLVYPGDAIRALPRGTFRLRLLAGGPQPRCLGTYTLHHSPWTD